MSNELTIFKNGALPSTAFRDAELPKARLGDGVGGAPFARVSYKASHWSIINQQKTDPLTRIIEGRMEENPNLDIVILKAANHPTKAWYKDAYDPVRQSAGPDCFSSNGMKPDADARDKQDSGKGCLNCPRNAWGSKIRRDTGEATRGKDCADHKKLVVVPVGDIENKIYGGPMLLQVPPSSLKKLAPYQNMLEANAFHYAQVWTRITFEQGADISYPMFKFDALAALDDVQAEQVLRMLKHPLVDQILQAAVQESDDTWNEAAGDRGTDQSTASIHVLRPAGTKPAETQAQTKPAETQAQTKPAEPAKAAPVQEKPALTPAQQEIADLKAKLAAAEKAAEPEPEPEPELTPEQKEIAELKAKLAAAGEAKVAKPRGGRPRQGVRTPAVAPTNMDSEKLAGPPLPEPVGVPAPGNDEAINRISDTLNKFKALI